MITYYRRELDRLHGQLCVDGAVPPETVWIDLSKPTPDETNAIEQQFAVEIPSADRMRRIEASDRLYRKGDVLYLTIIWIAHPEAATPERSFLSFILQPGLLITVHHGPIEPFTEQVRLAIDHEPAEPTASQIMLWLIDGLTEDVSALLERVENDLEELSTDTFVRNGEGPGDHTEQYRLLLRQIGVRGAAITKARQSLHSIGRMMGYLEGIEDHEKRLPSKRCKRVHADVRDLLEHAQFLSGNVSFLLDAGLGMINIEQNQIVKVFSIVAVLFMPPTMIGTLYGMNFENMPELHYHYGYYMALLAMLATGLLPYFYGRRRGWF